MTGPSHLSNYEAALWWMTTADQIINDTNGEELPAAAIASHAALIRASVYSSLAIADAIHSHTDQPTGACPATRDDYHNGNIAIARHCQYADGHNGAHRDEHGHTWRTEPVRVARCQHHSTDGHQCILTAGHLGIGHTDLTGIRWTTDNPTPTSMINADKQCTHTPDGDRRCMLDTNHPGEHITRTRGSDPCTARAVHNMPQANCARDTGHTGPHTTYAGKDF